MKKLFILGCSALMCFTLMGCQKENTDKPDNNEVVEPTITEPVECENLQEVAETVDFSLNRADVLALYEDMSYTVEPTDEGLVVIAKNADDTYMVVVADGIDLTKYEREGSYTNEHFSEETVNYLVSTYVEESKNAIDYFNENYYVHAAESIGGDYPFTNQADADYAGDGKFYNDMGPTAIEFVSEDDEYVTLKGQWGQHELPETQFKKDTLPVLSLDDVQIKSWGPGDYAWTTAKNVTIEFFEK